MEDITNKDLKTGSFEDNTRRPYRTPTLRPYQTPTLYPMGNIQDVVQGGGPGSSDAGNVGTGHS